MKSNHTQKNIQTSQRGFTIIETLVAIFILLITTTGPLAFAQSGLRAAFQARDQVTAFYLAQESLETIKNIRDYNQKTLQSNWLDNLGACEPVVEDEPISCDISLLSNPETITCSGACTQSLRYDADNTKQFQFNSGEFSKYTRTVYVTLINDHEIQVIVEVKWASPFLSGPKRITIQENIFKKYE